MWSIWATGVAQMLHGSRILHGNVAGETEGTKLGPAAQRDSRGLGLAAHRSRKMGVVARTPHGLPATVWGLWHTSPASALALLGGAGGAQASGAVRSDSGGPQAPPGAGTDAQCGDHGMAGYGRIGRAYSRRMLLPRREMSAP